MRVNIGEFDRIERDYGSKKIKEIRVGLLKEMKDCVWDYEELAVYVADNLKSIFEPKWNSYDHDCRFMSKRCENYSRIIESFRTQVGYIASRWLSDVMESVQTPVAGEYYRLRRDAHRNVFGTDISELYNSADYFKQFFELADNDKRESIIKSVFSMGERNDDVDEWLSDKYPDLVKKIGMDSVGGAQCQ